MPEPRPIQTLTQALTGIVVPAEAPRRRLPRLSSFRTEDPALRARYDDVTLWYGAVWLAGEGRLRLFGPPGLNLRPLLRSARYETEAGPLPAPRLRRFKRYVTAEFPLDRPVGTLFMEVAGQRLSMPVLTQDLQALAGLNTLYTMSQNNDLDWIEDWITYHHRHHGANGLVIADNGSTAYTPGELAERLSRLDFLKGLRVTSVPFRYGPSSAICRRASQARFLQTAIANLHRDLYLTRARAVLSCDIDELMISTSGRSVFDAAVARKLGFLTVPGYWRFSRVPSGQRARHADHLWIDPARSKPCPTKYVIRPDGALAGWSWMTHSLEALPRAAFKASPEFWFAHCHDISMRWKEGREATAGERVWQRDPVLEALWSA
ncbi:hypothetical protein [Pararhodobacter aggregans]|uniref:Uncharacterized protein n=1 Tax=Pararhodobacter aggregans TaxID=404875 RepID=A0A2T7UQJ6_9RHOB|nr:hypothetical protein [Pararhodobacter aggregans]PTX01790.1 hypothetical protein C8N33_1067 [Pararhodobacter aggregans]PVE46993.1 hypothetical protein DDE23_12065 [Pararhodobacter aggregans]